MVKERRGKRGKKEREPERGKEIWVNGKARQRQKGWQH